MPCFSTTSPDSFEVTLHSSNILLVACWQLGLSNSLSPSAALRPQTPMSHISQVYQKSMLEPPSGDLFSHLPMRQCLFSLFIFPFLENWWVNSSAFQILTILCTFSYAHSFLSWFYDEKTGSGMLWILSKSSCHQGSCVGSLHPWPGFLCSLLSILLPWSDGGVVESMNNSALASQLY